MSIEIKDTPEVELHGQSGDRTAGRGHAAQLLEGLSSRTWKDWKKHFAGRKKPARPGKLFGGKTSAVTWVRPTTLPDSPWWRSLQRTSKLFGGEVTIKQRDAGLLQQIEQIAAANPCPTEAALLAVGIASLLPDLAAETDQTTWSDALVQLGDLAAAAIDSEDDVQRQILAIELPLTLARQLPELPGCQALADQACDKLADEQKELLDSDGCIESRLISQVPALLATWTRSWMIADSLDYEFDDEAEARWEWFIRLALRLLRHDGSSMMSQPGTEVERELYHAAIRTSTDREDRQIGRLIWPDGKAIPKNKIPGEGGTSSEWAGMAVLQSNWSTRSPRIAVVTDAEDFGMEVCCGSTLFGISGYPSISINGGVLQPEGEWEEVCWHSDKDVDYLELELFVNDRLRLQRQICLLRQQEALFFADALLGESPERMDYELTLDLAPPIEELEESETTEIYLQDRKIRGLLLPLFLPEWKAERSDDQLECADGCIRLRRSAVARNLCSGLFVDLRPARSVKPRTWRSLTVGQELEIVPADVAVAWRVRIGKEQWVIYRSLTGPGNRTFLGQNYQCDFCIGRFEKDGNVTELLAIEA